MTFLVAIGFIAVMIAGGLAAQTVWRGQEYAALVDHTHRVEGQLAEYRLMIERSETARRGYILTGDGRYTNILNDSVSRIAPALDEIAELSSDNPRQRNRVVRLRELTANQIILLRATRDMVAAGNNAQALRIFRTDTSTRTIALIRAAALEMVEEEQRLLDQRTAMQRAAVERLYIILMLAALLVVAVGYASVALILRYTRALNETERELRGLNENLEGAVKERTQDLQRANDEIQRFAYIVSHDLRSPLVNVMGFTAELDTASRAVAELIERVETEAPGIATEEARVAAMEDLPEAIGFIRTSTQKMDRLINAILKLSRQGRRVIVAEPIDMVALLHNIRDTLQQRIEDSGAIVEIEQSLPAIVSDRVAVDQIFSNLIENALKYLKPGRPGEIIVRGHAGMGRAIFEVVDNGRGIDPRDHERIFDLFRRSGTQDQPGEGIGLAHVRALAYRLGGVIDCHSELDRGATFRLSIPIQYTAEQGALS
ncbi:ATP-binding protein [Sphingomonas sp. DBB INV C78]|uniref:sensor histidine kinase n=1 Tax=Sphingomonas sp. DBB INV C78 TaxID=3349434 RepID=UPI0036D316D2